MRGRKSEKTSQLREVKKLRGSRQTRRSRPEEQATDKTTSQASQASDSCKTAKIDRTTKADQAARVAQTSQKTRHNKVSQVVHPSQSIQVDQALRFDKTPQQATQSDQVKQVAQTFHAAHATYNDFAGDSRDMATRRASETGSNKKKSTHNLLLECAGQLFAERGYSGTSIKMIADVSKQNIAAVNYHFGTKQNLFVCALKHVLSHIMQPVETEADDAKETLAVRLRIFIHDRCMFLLSGKAPAWYGKLIVRAGFEIPFAEDQKSIEVFKPDFEFLENLAVRIKKDVDPIRARWWAYSVVGQIFFYVFGRDMIKIANPDTSFDIRTVNAISEHIYELSLEWLTHEQPPKPLRRPLNSKKTGRPA